MNYSERDLPVSVRETEMVTLATGNVVRFEESGGARDVFVDDEWAPRVSLFPGMQYELECPDCVYTLSAEDAGLRVERKS